MDWIKNLIRKRKQAIASKHLLEVGLEFRHTQLGKAAFIPKGTKGSFADKIMFPDDWSKAEFRAMADYMEAFPDCTLFSEGSGKPCR
jgi:hypothetical protein